MAEFVEKRAEDLKVGDRTQFGTGYETNFRTVSRVKIDRYSGIVEVWHRETDERFSDSWGAHAMVKVVREGWEPTRLNAGATDE